MYYAKRFTLFLLLSAALVVALQVQLTVGQSSQSVDYVNPYIGNIRHVLEPVHPMVHLPNSYLRITPERSGYTDVTLQGLPLISKQESSLAFRLSPYQGDPQGLRPVIPYSYDNEQITPYSYSVILDNQETKVELGVSRQSAMYRWSFNGEGTPFVVLNSKQGMLQWDGQGLSGYQVLSNDTKAYVYAVPDKTPSDDYVLRGNGKLTDKSQMQGEDASIVLEYPEETEQVSLRYGISFISTDQARKNMEREIGDKDLATLQDEARKIWNNALGKITVEGGTDDDKTVFYTALYRSLNRPVSISEDGRYFSAIDGQVHEDQGTPFYTDDGAWSTYRVLHPLNVLINPQKEEDILSSYLRMAGQKPHFQMPKYVDFTGDYAEMHSNHIIVSFLDAYRKGLQIDLDKALDAGKNTVMQRTLAPASDDSAGTLNKFYRDYGYIPAFWVWEDQKETYPEVNPSAKRQAVSVTLGTAYDDWALAQMAKEEDQQEVFQQFCRRSFNYRKVFNPGTGFFHPKDERGILIDSFDYLDAGSWNEQSDYYKDHINYYTEGNGWTYRFGLQYNIADHIDMMGGRDSFDANLDALFTTLPRGNKFNLWIQFPERTGIVGQFAMGNEPAFHKPYLYNYAGQPWKTQKRIRMLMQNFFQNDLMGMPGVDEGGAMSAFVVFSYMGFYPVTPGIPIYNIGSPIFDQIVIQLPGGNKFEVVANNNSSKNKYIQSATLNGEPLNKPWFRHSDIMEGGKLVLQMGPRPNKQWGSGSEAAPPSVPFELSACKN